MAQPEGIRTITARIEAALPTWMHIQDHWIKLSTVLAMGADAMIQGAWDLLFAGMPGQNAYGPFYGGFPNTDALPLLARDRRLYRGFLESPESVASRCRRYRDLWKRAGTAFAILEQVAAICSTANGPPLLRIWTGGGTCYTREPGGLFRVHTPAGTGFALNIRTGETSAVTTPAHPWDWDSQTNPGASPKRIFLVIYAPVPGLIDGDEGTYGDGASWYETSEEVIGIDTSLSFLESVRAVLTEWRCEGIATPWILVTFDPASFDPETPGPYPAAGMPDGWWGNAWRPDPGDPTTLIESRPDFARYVPGNPDDGVVTPLGTV